MINSIQNIDAAVLLFIQYHVRTPFLNGIMIFFSYLGNSGLIWILLGLMLFIPKCTRRRAFISLLCLLSAFIINDLLIKYLVCRPRPYNTISGLSILVKPLKSYSFPSGHANSSFAMAMALSLAFGKKGALAYIPAAMIAFSRCYVGVHYPSDVLVGAVVGTLAAYFTYKLLDKHLKKSFLFKKE